MLEKAINNIASFVKYNRSRLKLTQETLAEKAGVGLRFIRDLEQGKESLRMDKVNQVLNLFGHQVAPGSATTIDPYIIRLFHMNRRVKIVLRDKTIHYGIILGALTENNEINRWKFISNNNAREYQKTEDPKLEKIIENKDIAEIETF